MEITGGVGGSSNAGGRVSVTGGTGGASTALDENLLHSRDLVSETWTEELLLLLAQTYRTNQDQVALRGKTYEPGTLLLIHVYPEYVNGQRMVRFHLRHRAVGFAMLNGTGVTGGALYYSTPFQPILHPDQGA